jgi:transposase-like protein
MPNPCPTALRERAVRAYELSTDTYVDVAAQFSIGVNTLVRSVQERKDVFAVQVLVQRVEVALAVLQ